MFLLLKTTLHVNVKWKKDLDNVTHWHLFLFLIIEEWLAAVVRQDEKKGMQEGIRVGSDEIHINILQFADDTLFFVNHV